MTVRSDIRTEVQNRLQDVAAVIWTVSELNGYIGQAIKSLYPTYYQLETATTVATAGPMQTMPANARNLYYIGLVKTGSTRARLLRQWREGKVQSFIPKVGITGETLVWSWTQPFTPPTDDTTVLDLNSECEEVVVLRTHITALERIVTSRVETAKYFALTVREGVSEADLIQTIDALHASLDQRLKQAIPRPARVG